MIVRIILLCMVLFFLTACASPPAEQPVEQNAVPTTIPTRTITATNTPPPTPTTTPQPTASPTPEPTPTPEPVVLIGAGDISYCGEEYQGDENTAAIIEQYPNAAVFTAGDNVYGEGKTAEFNNCFDPTWGKFKDRIRPVPGNHDYMTAGAAPYYAYFGEAAGPPGQGYYSYDLGSWHIVALNSNCNDIACGPNSQQTQWLLQDLANSAADCTLLYWHHPRFTSGLSGNYGSANPFWRAAVEHGAEIVVNGHDHNYERMAPVDVDGQTDPDGVRQFIVGTGGSPTRDFGEILPQSEARYNGGNGVMKFTLYPGSYEWEFLSVNGDFTDSGSGACH